MKHKNKFLLIVGSISSLFAFLGLFLPLLPTTPFLLLAAYCFSKSSKRLHNSLLNNKFFGEYLRRYRDGEGVSLRQKISSISTLWITMIVSAFFFLPMELWWIGLIMFLVAVSVTVHLLRLKTYREENATDKYKTIKPSIEIEQNQSVTQHSRHRL